MIVEEYIDKYHLNNREVKFIKNKKEDILLENGPINVMNNLLSHMYFHESLDIAKIIADKLINSIITR